MENGFSPCDETRNVEITLIDENGKPWSPKNTSKGHYGEMVTLKWGLANSNNWISAEDDNRFPVIFEQHD